MLFISDDHGGFTVTTTEALVQAMWTNNRGGDRFDAGAAVRDFRDEGALQQAEAQARIDAYLQRRVSDEREEAERLFNELGFPVRRGSRLTHRFSSRG